MQENTDSCANEWTADNSIGEEAAPVSRISRDGGVVMWKKLIYILGSLFLLVVLISCNRSEEAFVFGVWDDDVFVSEPMGIQFQLPNSWRAFEGDELDEFQQFLARGFVATPRLRAEMLGVNFEFTYDMIAHTMVSSTAGQVQFLYGRLNEDMRHTPDAALEMMFHRTPREVTTYTAFDLLEAVQDSLRATGITTFSIYADPVMIGRYEFYVMQTTTATFANVVMPRRIYLNLTAGNVSMIIVTGSCSDCLASFMNHFNAPEDSRLNIARAERHFYRENEVSDPEQLIGNWRLNDRVVWPHGFGFSVDAYTFEAGGRGNRVFEDGYVQEFEWQLFEGALAIRINRYGALPFTELWQTTLVGEELFIQNFTVAEMELSYARED